MGDLIALCGIDGAGKSTQAELLQKRLQAAGQSTEVLWCRWDPVLARPAVRLLDRLARRGRSTVTASNARVGTGDSRRKLKRRLLASSLVRGLWTSLMVLDYGLQVAPKVRRAQVRAEVVIVDRYRHDVLIDLSAGDQLARTPAILAWALPDPDMIIVLDVDEEVALARKPDSPDLTYLRERRRLYRQLAAGPTSVLVDASESTGPVSEAVFEAIASQLDAAGTRSRAVDCP